MRVYYRDPMSSKRLRRLVLSIAILSLFGTVPRQAIATSLTLPLTPHISGLTFIEPLTFTTQSLPTPKIHITFGKSEALHIIPIKKQNIALEKRLAKPTPTPTAVPPTPTMTPTPTPTVRPTSIPAPAQSTPTASNSMPASLSTGGLNADRLFDMSNSYRASKGLPALQKDERSCQLAVSRAPEINAEIAGGYMHAGLRSRNLPYWNTENIISMRNEEEAFNWWINDTIHREAIEGNYTYSCVACSGNACAQEFTNYQPK